MIPIDELRTWVGAEESAETDALLTQLEAFALAQVELTTGRYLGPSAEFVDRIIGDGAQRLRLPKGPVTEVTSVTEAWVTVPDDVATAVTDFVLRDPFLIATNAYVWVKGAEYEVTYTAGYADGEAPAIYREAVLGIVAATYAAHLATQTAIESATVGGDIKRETFGDYTVELTEASSGSSSSSRATGGDSVTAILAQLPRRIRV